MAYLGPCFFAPLRPRASAYSELRAYCLTLIPRRCSHAASAKASIGIQTDIKSPWRAARFDQTGRLAGLLDAQRTVFSKIADWRSQSSITPHNTVGKQTAPASTFRNARVEVCSNSELGLKVRRLCRVPKNIRRSIGVCFYQKTAHARWSTT